MDYVFRFLGNRFLQTEVEVEEDQEEPTGLVTVQSSAPEPKAVVAGGSGSSIAAPVEKTSSFVNQADAPSCLDCGSIMLRNGACYKCPNCGSTSGCS